jgi:DNA invertase Pin-like site-specific DNA recombinase
MAATKQRAEEQEKPPGHVPPRKLSISYFRVSTAAQTAEGRSGLDRQEQALQAWLRAHPEYELVDRLQDLGVSAGRGLNRKEGALGWFLDQGRKGRLVEGTCLVVESMSRFSREPILDVLKTLNEIFDLNLAISFCDHGGKILDKKILDEDSSPVFMIVGAAQAARREWQEKAERARGSAKFKVEQIKEGKLPYSERTKEKPRAMYPFWLDFDAKTQQFKPNKHEEWVKKIFLYAPEIGSITIQKRLKAAGYRQAFKGGIIQSAQIVGLLNNRAVLGIERKILDNGEFEEIHGVFPPIVSPEEWRLAREAVDNRLHRKVSIPLTRLHNLFQGSSFCFHCGGKINVLSSVAIRADGNKKEYIYLSCATNSADEQVCPCSKRIKYDEEKILNRVHDFRWADYFSDHKHEQGVASARHEVLARQDALGQARRGLDVMRKNINDLMAKEGGADLAMECGPRLQELTEEFNNAEADLNMAQSALAKLEKRQTGAQAQAHIRKQVTDFLASNRHDIEQRKSFNRWLNQYDLVVAFDLMANRFEIGAGKFSPVGELIELDQVLEDAAGLGLDVNAARKAFYPESA